MSEAVAAQRQSSSVKNNNTGSIRNKNGTVYFTYSTTTTTVNQYTFSGKVTMTADFQSRTDTFNISPTLTVTYARVQGCEVSGGNNAVFDAYVQHHTTPTTYQYAASTFPTSGRVPSCETDTNTNPFPTDVPANYGRVRGYVDDIGGCDITVNGSVKGETTVTNTITNSASTSFV